MEHEQQLSRFVPTAIKNVWIQGNCDSCMIIEKSWHLTWKKKTKTEKPYGIGIDEEITVSDKWLGT